MTPPPRPVPTMADSDECRSASAPKCTWWAYRAAALPSLVYTTGRPTRASRAPRKSKPRQAGAEKLVDPLDEMTPVALAGPGVSRPTAATADRAVPVSARMLSIASASASTATSGPSSTRLGVSTMRSTRNRPDASRTVALLLVPPLSRPTTTRPSEVPTDSHPTGAGVVEFRNAHRPSRWSAARGARHRPGDRPAPRAAPRHTGRRRPVPAAARGGRPTRPAYRGLDPALVQRLNAPARPA